MSLQETVCLQCGDEGFPNAFVYCVKCLNLAVHRYCLHELPKTFDEFVRWICEDCEAESEKHTHQKSGAKNRELTCSGGTKDPLSTKLNKMVITRFSAGKGKCHGQNEPLLQSAYGILDQSEGAQLTADCHLSEVKLKDSGDTCLKVVESEQGQSSSSPQLNQQEEVQVVADSSNLMKKNDSSSSISRKREETHYKTNKQLCTPYRKMFDKDGQLESDSNLPNQLKKEEVSCSFTTITEQRFRRLSSLQNHESRMALHSGDHKRESAPENEGILAVHTRTDVNEKVSQLPTMGQPTIIAGDYLGRAQPLVDPIWRGSFNILSTCDDALEGFVAHLSSRACQKVYDVASKLPSLLQLEMLPKAKVWPKSFKMSDPTDDNIALYIFPENGRYEKKFDHLVDEMTKQELAMRASLKNADLLIFTSTELPLLYWRFQSKFYLWGVFRSKQSSSSRLMGNHTVPFIVQERINGVNNMGISKENTVSKMCATESPLSPLSNSTNFVTGNF